MADEHWVPVRFRDEDVLARCGPDGALLAGPGGLVEFAYREGGKRYRTHADKLVRSEDAGVVAATRAPTVGAASTAKPAPTATPKPTRAAATRAGLRIGTLGDRRGPEVAIELWTDGACSGNPGPAGLGVSREHRGERIDLSEYLGHATNNIAELTAILRGLELVEDASAPVDVMTDSEYCIGLLAKGWKPKKNQELVAELRAALARFGDIQLLKVPGHAGVEGNERVDELARAAITSRKTTRFRQERKSS